MKHLRYVWRYLWCQWRHKQYHTDVQWELISVGSPSNCLLDVPHVWRVWFSCIECGVGWTGSREQEVSDCKRGDHHSVPQNQGCSFHNPDGKNPRKV